MALTNYADLKDEVSAYLNRSDISDAQISNFVEFAESSFDRVIRVRDQIKRSTANISTQYIALPTDLLELHNIQLNTNPIASLEQVSLGYADQLKSTTNASGRPRYFAISGEQIEFIPSPDQTYEIELVYYASLVKLTNENNVNWLLTKNPDIYLYGVLMQAEPFLMNDERIQVWASMLEKGLEEMRLADDKAQSNSATVSLRPSRPLDNGDW